MSRSISDRVRKAAIEARIARRIAKDLDQKRRQQEANEVKVALNTWKGVRTGTTG